LQAGEKGDAKETVPTQVANKTIAVCSHGLSDSIHLFFFFLLQGRCIVIIHVSYEVFPPVNKSDFESMFSITH
jgi:hypothetical protein